MKKPIEYPLVWPEGWPRAKSRKRAAFMSGKNALTYFRAEERVKRELALLANVKDPIISSNMIRERQPADPGVAVYFQERDKPMRVIAIDIYDRVEDNIGAVAATIEALRAIARHGGAQILERAFTGFDALPPPDDYRTLGVGHGASKAAIEAAYKSLAKTHHPDKGGDAAQFARITDARDRLLKDAVE